METITGLLHIHTTYSYDGRITLDDCAAVARAKGHSFLLLTEHNNQLSDRKMEVLCKHSRRLSDDTFRVIPGLEIDCDFGKHLLAVGISRYLPGGKPEEVARAIADSGGLTILPHPALYQFRSFLSSGSYLNGVEVWNTRYDSSSAPNPKSFDLLERLRLENPSIFAYGGQDLHEERDFDWLCLTVDVPLLNDAEVLRSLEKGLFSITRKNTVIGAAGAISARQKLMFDIRSSARLLKESFRRSMIPRS